MRAFIDIEGKVVRLVADGEEQFEQRDGTRVETWPDELDPLHYRWPEGEPEPMPFWGLLDTELHAKIDAEAGEVRKRFITEIPGQQVTYRLKEEEARRWLPGVSDLQQFPYLRLEAEAKGITVDALVAIVKRFSAQWHLLNARIEAARTAAKDAVLAATTFEAKQAAAQVDWESVIDIPPPPPPVVSLSRKVSE